MAASYYINTFDLPPDQAREIWREITDETYELSQAGSAGSYYRFATRMWFSPVLLFFRIRAQANTIVRPSKLVEGSPTRLIKVKLFKYGGETIQLDGEKHHLDSGALHFIDQNRSKSETYSDHELDSIFLPYDALGYDPSTHPPVFSVSLESAVGRFLSASVEAAFQELEHLSQNDLPVLAESLSGTLRSVFTHGTKHEKYSNTRNDQIRALKVFIEENLNYSWLGVDRISEELHLSRATLFRHLEEYGGVNRYILSRRLSRAYRDLSEAQPVRGVVKDVAQRWGFSSHAHFSRLFKEEFDVSPVSLVGRWVQNPKGAALTDNAQEQGNTSQYAPSIAALKWAYERYR
ncbi:AraC family transcriptional regulator [Tateyamaria pelophila]|uniref:AraC family transcriptional regulator n=1 Tax=Tateyamaria pelophila TaxID=328415 RepID=UPI001CBB66DE|nr:AraC family transcriptional regulator [Tateyamaria pelophila]